jgi:hypothetical protein
MQVLDVQVDDLDVASAFDEALGRTVLGGDIIPEFAGSTAAES